MEKCSRTQLVVMAVIFLTVMCSYAAGQSTFNLVGTVKDGQGAAVTDAFVRAKDLDKGIAKIVLTNGGRYIIPDLSPGNYRIDSWKWGFDLAGKEMGALSKDTNVDFALEAWSRPVRTRDLTETDWLMILPGGKSEGKNISDKMFYAYPAMILGALSDLVPARTIDFAVRWNHKRVEKSWEYVMAQIDGGHFFWDPHLMRHWPGWREAIIRYMEEAFHPDKVREYELKHFAPPITEASRLAVWTQYDIPSPVAGAHTTAVDSQGNVYFSEIFLGRIGRLDAKTGEIKEYIIPRTSDRGDPKYKDQEFYYHYRQADRSRYAGFSGSAGPHGVAIDGDDNVWISLEATSAIAKFEPKTETFKFYPTQNWDQNSAFAAVDKKRKRAWVGGDFFGDAAHMVDIPTGEVKTVALGTDGIIPYGMNLDKDGNVYVAAIHEGALYRIDAETFEVKKYWPPTDFSGIHRMCGDSKGRMWLSLSASMKLGMWDPKTEKITEYDLPMEYGHPYGCAVDQDDTVWYTDFFSMFVAGFDSDTKTYTVYPQPSEGPRADVRSVAVGPNGNIWFTDIRYNKVTKLDPHGLAHISPTETNVSRR